MAGLSLTNLVLVGWLLWIVVRRQLEARVIRFKGNFFVLVILLGIASIGDAYSKQTIKISTQTAFVFGTLSLISAVLFGLLRALTYRFWVNNDGLVMREGNWLTLVLWLTSIIVHLGIDQLWTGSNVTLLLYFGLTLGVQRGWVWYRAQRQFPNEIHANVEAQYDRSQSRRRRSERKLDR
ncbi:hypothetical protein [Companilactobacillus ginsenosidimutans]|uniref:hypothetical protein n=1 Tax=Companilactobacillus ginsenosidimutans TaxID=1007676 RepID=UPI0006614932|nr:hypothetical protein [Companilactobacillus ginsenosidimutans]